MLCKLNLLLQADVGRAKPPEILTSFKVIISEKRITGQDEAKDRIERLYDCFFFFQINKRDFDHTE